MSTLLIMPARRKTVDHTSPVGLAVQLANIVRADIESGTYGPGTMLPSEKQLMQDHELARGTVRKALQILADEKLAVALAGRGWLVKKS